ncbi:MAG: DUF4350 domain-containing protein [Dehalococcoidales bacterium]|nr:DUF4350 domain-containing protein [Dehalococcoidales bacterium]
MRVRSLLAITLAVVLFVSWLSIILYPSVQDFMGANPFWNGVRDFGRRFDAEMLPSLDQLTAEPEGNVLVVIPYLPYQDGELQPLVDFVSGGGTLLLMDDYGYGNQVLGAMGLDMKFDSDPLLDPYLNYRNQEFPVIVELAPEFKDAGIKELVLNHATALITTNRSETLARSSDMSFLDSNGNAAWDIGESKGPFPVAVRATVGSGTVVAVSDPSIIISGMVGRGDNEKFLTQLISQAGESPRVSLDASHLPKAPLDSAKDVWVMVRQQLVLPYSQALLVGAVLTLSFMPRFIGAKRSRN